MNKLTLFHGTTEETLVPQYGKGKPYNDYGMGFYCTQDLELAKEWACRSMSDGFVHEFDLNMEGLKTLRLDKRPYNYLNWLALLISNRKFSLKSQTQKRSKDFLTDNYMVDTSGYDVIIGYRADDSYFEFAREFLSNSLSLYELKNCMRLGGMRNQIVLKSENAFEHLQYMTTYQVPKDTYWVKYSNRDKRARQAFEEPQSQSAKDDVYINQIINGGWRNDDPRLF